MVRDVLLLPGGECGVKHGVDSKVRLTPSEPGGRIVGAHHDGQSQGSPVDTGLEPLAGTTIENLELHTHTIPGCKIDAVTRYPHTRLLSPP